MNELTPQAVEELLGNPDDPANPYGFAAAVARDEADAHPDELCRTLVSAGFHLNYLPREWGGTLASFADSMTLVRAAARRDVNVMPGTMFSIIAATCLQLHGSEEQRRRVAGILTRGGSVAFALTEADHGSDLLSGEVRLDEDGRLYGEKWMVGNGLRCEAVYVLARTGKRGPGAFSAFLLDPESEGLVREPGARTGGMRGVDTARLRFTGLRVPDDALVGKKGEGLEVAVLAQQAVRLMSMAGSLGCADTALRLTLGFAAERRVAGRPLAESPHARRDLAIASAALLAADAVALAAARGIHVAPGSFSVWALTAKHVVAESTDELVRRCAGVLATRSVLREQAPGAGLFQKLQRDVTVVRVIDASPLANLRAYAAQIPSLARRADAADQDALRQIFDLDAELPPYEPARLDLVVRGADPVTGQLPDVSDFLEDRTAALVWQLGDALAMLEREAAAVRRPGACPTALVDLAERYAWLHAAAACVHLWWANRGRSLYGGEPGDPGWLRAALAFLLARADGVDPRRAGADLLPALDTTLALTGDNRLLTALPVPLAPASHRMENS
ncbi:MULTISPECIES: acyl-CoA dehydrogenase family protein [unclassified Streptomyces]|uniref:acyl-CoA dehydrogenase family protein n=1 Tax=unclassified Streptomyces TaxID=2593676 RepID=UPI0022569137|nr:MULTISPECIES: acyl-CoA dehydrogenase family protein [unclassified Streptomyces]MCX5063058.1 acyl-CoA dehydrogenase family protein [Streptomyces sp. NBC_00452]